MKPPRERRLTNAHALARLSRQFYRLMASPRRKSQAQASGVLARRQEHAPQGKHKHAHAHGPLAVPPIRTDSSFLMASRPGITPKSLRRMDTAVRRRAILRTPAAASGHWALPGADDCCWYPCLFSRFNTCDSQHVRACFSREQ